MFSSQNNTGGMFGSQNNAGGMFGTSRNGMGSSFSSGTSGSSGGFSDFMNSNSLVAKISFLLLAIFVFVIVLQFSITFIVWLGTPSGSPHLIDGMVDAKQMMVIPQDPNSEGAKTVTRSTNTPDGIEFTWSVWIFIDDLTYNAGKYRHIFHKGNNDFTNSQELGLNFPNNAPGLYLSPNSNELTVVMNTFDVINQEIKIPDIPLNKWVNIMIRCKNTTLDVYINGTITKSTKLIGVPKQNYGDVYVGANGGFSGYISNLWYYNYALGTNQIQKIVNNGPNRKMTGTDSLNSDNSSYLSLRWFFYGGQ
uniref:LamG-like jellyroll fold domain-containing protein n=1 Tax=viral metagenome TaxID=1070528 RepID=A0A6C0KVU4_9ZZZZ